MKAKELRSQVRNVFQENLEEVLKIDLVAELQKKVLAHVDSRLDAIAKRVESVLAEVDSRSKDTAAFIQRQAITQQVKVEVKE